MAKDRYLQALRGLAISAVVLIHCLPQCAASVAIRPFGGADDFLDRA